MTKLEDQAKWRGLWSKAQHSFLAEVTQRVGLEWIPTQYDITWEFVAVLKLVLVQTEIRNSQVPTAPNPSLS